MAKGVYDGMGVWVDGTFGFGRCCGCERDELRPTLYEVETRSRRFLGWRVRSFTPGFTIAEAKAASDVSKHHAPSGHRDERPGSEVGIIVKMGW